MNNLIKSNQKLNSIYTELSPTLTLTPNIYKSLIETLNITNLSYNNKLLIVNFFITLYASQFRIKVKYHNNTLPMNNISFLFAKSGSGKDLSHSILTKIFSPSMDIIYERMLEQFESSLYAKKEIVESIRVGVSTSEGINKLLNNLHNTYEIGEAYIYTGEFIQEQSNVNLHNLLRDITEIFSEGNKSVKQIKDSKTQLKEIKNSGLGALFASDISELYSNKTLRESISTDFKRALARRCYISVLEEVDLKEISFEESIELRTKQERESEKCSNYFKNITEQLLNTNDFVGKVYNLSNEAYALLLKYKLFIDLYTTELSKKDLLKYEADKKLYVLHITDNHLRAVKLSGALALITGSNEIKLEHIKASLSIVHNLSFEMLSFNQLLNKTQSEIFVSIANKESESEVTYTASDLVKSSFLSQKWKLEDLNRLVTEANQIDESTYYEVENQNSIKISKLDKNYKHSMSIKPLNNIPKNQRHTMVASGYTYKSFTSFTEVSSVLNTDCSFCAFEYINGIRSSETTKQLTTMLVFDVDSSYININDLHSILTIENINHHLGTTSDKDNLMKYRLIIELDAKYHIKNEIFKKLMSEVSKTYLLDTITIDTLPLSQMYYGYKDSLVLSYTNGNKISLKEVLVTLNRKIKPKPELTKAQKEELLRTDNISTEFYWAYNVPIGHRSNTLIRVINRCYDLSASIHKAKQIVEEINSNFDNPLTQEELEKTIYPHINKKLGTEE